MPTALLSVWDKTGLVQLATALHDRGWRIFASAGTARVLEEANVPAQPVSRLTGEPEMLDGRVKTLHPAIHAGLLASNSPDDRAALEARGWELIDLVAVNLYPFEAVTSRADTTLQQAIEQIDIGGVALLRAAAKNFERVSALSDPADYLAALDPPDPEGFRLAMAKKAFARTAAYDAAIEDYFEQLTESAPIFRLRAYPAVELRYGENPHQTGIFYSFTPGGGPLGGELIQGKPISYNNMLDCDSAWRAARLFPDPSAVVIKHASPCGIASAPTSEDAVRLAIASDSMSAFGSVIAHNRPVGLEFARALDELFVECLVAPDFSIDARRHLESRPNLRLLRNPSAESSSTDEFRSVLGGILWQSVDRGDPSGAQAWRTVTQRPPTQRELSDLQFAWKACQPVRSNAIVLARSESHSQFTVGIGGGQPNRIDSVDLAGRRAGERAAGAVLASDAFFPFPDGVEAAAALGVTAIVQPGGSRRDYAVIEAANAAGMAMVFTGLRHFRH
jgi:phosphoribosylaminoimidazolecarboxamide formyltransferase/IMP cyclohydrolase